LKIGEYAIRQLQSERIRGKFDDLLESSKMTHALLGSAGFARRLFLGLALLHENGLCRLARARWGNTKCRLGRPSALRLGAGMSTRPPHA
jgi:hypothetical protein